MDMNKNPSVGNIFFLCEVYMQDCPFTIQCYYFHVEDNFLDIYRLCRLSKVGSLCILSRKGREHNYAHGEFSG